MPPTKRTDPYDHPCAVKECNNVAEKYGICRTHYRQVVPFDASKARMIEHMTEMHKLGQKHTRKVQRLARDAGLTLVTKPTFRDLGQL